MRPCFDSEKSSAGVFAFMAQKQITIRGRVITRRMGRIAVVCLRNRQRDEYDTDIPLAMLPKEIENGAEVTITIKVRESK